MITSELVLPFSKVRATDLPLVGGKGANLGELTHAGFPVPPGFCVTAESFRRFLAQLPNEETLYADLETLSSDDALGARRLAERWQNTLRTLPVPLEVEAAVVQAWAGLGEDFAYAVRSSATAEDLPDASFAGQQDTYLNVRSRAGLLNALRDCWASLFNERAILYRQQRGVPHRGVSLAVVVQRLVTAEVSGILFTADPITGNRFVASIDASFGLGEALVSGLVSADNFKVDSRTGRILERRVSDKALAIQPNPDGGVTRVELEGDARTRWALSDAEALELTALGARIEAHYGAPQDIEWARAQGAWFVLQARPITTLFPLPEPRPSDSNLHAYLSFSHFQVMTDAMPPLAASVWRLLFPFGRTLEMLENPVLTVAGGRLYVDASYALRHPLLRRALPRVAGENIDALIGAALLKLANRTEFSHGPRVNLMNAARGFSPILARAMGHLLFPASGGAASRALGGISQRVAEIDRRISGAGSLEARLEITVRELTELLGRATLPLAAEIVTGILADALLRRLATPFAEKTDLAALTPGLQGNVTTEMGLAVGDLADAAHDFPALAEHLRRTDLSALERLRVEHLPGGASFLKNWHEFLGLYGSRAPSEIDLSRPRWREDPTSLLNMLAGNLESPARGEHRIRAARQAVEAQAAGERVIRASGSLRGSLVRHLLRVIRTYLPLREHLKFLIVRVLDKIKPVLLEAGGVLTERGQLEMKDDAWFLTFPELRDALADSSQALLELIAARHRRFQHEARLAPPRGVTSDGEQIRVSHAGDHVPEGALAGQGVSAGVVEGVVRVIFHPNEAVLRPGEILVAPFTDPAWTPLFVAAAGLVTEVGGLMTHGSLVAREYGIPAVVGVADATQILRTGQRVRVDGDLGYVQVLEVAPAPKPGTGSLEAVLGAGVGR